MLAAALTWAAVVTTGPAWPASPVVDPTVGEDRPATANYFQRPQAHNTPALAVDPTESRFVALANRLDAPQFDCALQLSGDGGRGFVPARPVPMLPAGSERCYGPEVAFGPDGVLYYLFLGLAGEGNVPMGAFLTTSSDRGRTFSAPRKVLGPYSFAVRMAVDPNAGARGRLHLVWLAASERPPLGSMPAPPNPIRAAHSDDGGRTFSEPVTVAGGDGERVVAPVLALGPSGAVHVAYYDLEDDARDYSGLEGPVWEDTWSLAMSSSTDGGRSFGARAVIDRAVVPPERVMLIFTMAPASLVSDSRGRLYAAWHDARNGDWDVFMRRSVDGGWRWSAPVRVNDDPVGNGRHQYQPRLAVAPDGRLDAVFYDRRHDPENLRNHVAFTFSDDAGSRFATNRLLTSKPSDTRVGQSYAGPAAQGLVEFGSRLGLLSTPARAVAAWTDTRNAQRPLHQDVFSTVVDFGGQGVPVASPRRGASQLAGVAAVVGAAAAVAALSVGRHRRRSLRAARSSPAA